MKKLLFSIAFIFSILFSFSKNELKLDSISTIKDTTKFTEIYDRAEVMPSFPGGSGELMKYFQRNIKYPSSAREKNLEGKVIVKVYIDIDGTVKHPEVLKDGVGGEDCAAEAIRVINAMPKWSPGMQRGLPVKVYYVIPISFKLNDNPIDANTGQIISAIKDAEVTGGEETIKKYQQSITSKIKKSKADKDKKIIIKISFIIDENGSITNAIVVEKNTEDKSIIQKILDGVNKMPKWKPATFKDKPLSSSKILTFEF
ncbi:MAG TPA: energy transducer TonB [Chitinophagales bacterium]|nr:energy transducer TonB [Chitinophagales bacterium]